MAASKQASKQASIHIHVRNEVTLVWGSLRLAPKTSSSIFMVGWLFMHNGVLAMNTEIPNIHIWGPKVNQHTCSIREKQI